MPTRSSRSSPPRTSARCRTRTSPTRCRALPGVTVSSASANEGGFDENDRISMRGTNPSLTQTLHQRPQRRVRRLVRAEPGPAGRPQRQLHAAAVGARRARSSCTRAAQASLVEGGVAGSVDIITRKPLDFPDQFTFERVGRRRLRRAAGRDRSAAERPLQLEERRRHARRDAAGVLRGAAPAARRGRSCSVTGRSRPAAPSRPRIPDLSGVAVSGPDRRRAVRAAARAHRRPDRHRDPAERRR